MSFTINQQVALTTIECYKCAVLFAMPTSLKNECLNDHSRSFYCPNGHGQVYSGETETRKLQEQLEAERKRTAHWIGQSDQLSAELQSEAKSHAVTKGKLTKIRNRVNAGVCSECNRTFPNLASHMADVHARNTYAKHSHA